jgi:5-methylcytosine-specific restriction endonuclease McrA
MHFRRFKRHGDPLMLVTEKNGLQCKFDGCETKPVAKNLCSKHWRLERRKTLGKCSLSDCNNKVHAKGMCSKHYAKASEEFKGICQVDGCEKKVLAKGMCNAHYTMFRLHGDPLAGAYRIPFKKAIDHGDGTRTCTRCMEKLPISSFHKDKHASDGLRAMCKKCRINNVKDWYQDNIAERREKANTRRRDNVETERIKDNERYKRDREKRIALATEHSHRRKARKLNTVVEKGISVLSLKKRYGTKCHYCQKEMDFSKGVGRKFNSDMATIEHLIPLARGGEHTFANTVLACRFCNISRGAKSQEDFEEYRKEN